MTQGLRMPPDLMRELAAHVTEILVERSQRLGDEPAWDGEFKQELAARLMEDPPESGREPREIIDRAVQDVLLPAVRHDHPRAFGFVPSAPTWPGVLADYLVLDNLASAVEADRDAGCAPVAVCPDAGSTSTGAVDPLDAIADYCEVHGIWLHVDAAYGGAGADDERELHRLNRNVLARVFWEDRAFISSTLLHGRFALRMCVINHTTTWDDVRETLETIERFGREAL